MSWNIFIGRFIVIRNCEIVVYKYEGNSVVVFVIIKFNVFFYIYNSFFIFEKFIVDVIMKGSVL